MFNVVILSQYHSIIFYGTFLVPETLSIKSHPLYFNNTEHILFSLLCHLFSFHLIIIFSTLACPFHLHCGAGYSLVFTISNTFIFLRLYFAAFSATCRHITNSIQGNWNKTDMSHFLAKTFSENCLSSSICKMQIASQVFAICILRIEEDKQGEVLPIGLE